MKFLTPLSTPWALSPSHLPPLIQFLGGKNTNERKGAETGTHTLRHTQRDLRKPLMLSLPHCTKVENKPTLTGGRTTSYPAKEGKIEGKRRENGISSSYQRKSEIKIIRPSSCELSSGNVIISENWSTIWRQQTPTWVFFQDKHWAWLSITGLFYNLLGAVSLLELSNRDRNNFWPVEKITTKIRLWPCCKLTIFI